MTGLGLSTSGGASEEPRVRRHVEAYATAACLAAQKDEVLKEQGYRWAEVLVQGRGLDFDSLDGVRSAVAVSMHQGHMPIMRDDSQPMATVALPVMYCAEIIDDPGVRAAIEATLPRLSDSGGDGLPVPAGQSFGLE